MNFKEYSKYYDIIYKNKKYDVEANYIHELISKFNPNSNSILNLGCGTGNHDFLLQKLNYKIVGLDLSKEMIEIANEKNKSDDLKFIYSNIQEFDLNQKFDNVISLFHVMSYQKDNYELDKVFSNVERHLNNEGVFIFDFWYGPAVLTDLPINKKINFKEGNVKILRKTKSKVDYNRNIVNVNFQLEIEDEGTQLSIEENHEMRYLFLPELEYFLKKNNLEIINSSKFMSEDTMSEKSWYGIIIAKKCKK